MEGCVNLTDGMNLKDDENNILVLRRQTQTVRAVEPNTGVERWNFSVAQHDIKFLKDHSPECHGDRSTSNEKKSEDFELKVVIPDGVVCAVSKQKPNKIIWKQKFTSPVVHAWQLDGGHMNTVDLFSSATVSLYNTESKVPPSTEPPKLYIGMHNKQLYIQESTQMQKLAKHLSLQVIESSNNFLRIPWKPFPASKNALEIIQPKSSNDQTALQPIETSPTYSTTALSVLYASEYINGNGFFLFSNVEKKKESLCPDDSEDPNHSIHTASNNTDIFGYDDEDEMPVQIIGSLWFWWKEVLAISIATAVFVNLFLTQRFMRLMRFRMARQMGYRLQPDPTWGAEKLLCLGADNDSGIELYRSKKVPSDNAPFEDKEYSCVPDFTSRYLTDFEPMHRLGKGGFGVVFEARNKIDDCNYAIKRIPLPNRQTSRERVMREVKALAKLDHQNIVRYFNAWLECPPPGWQEEQDKTWVDSDPQSESPFSLTPKDATSIDLSENSNVPFKGLGKLKHPIALPLMSIPETASGNSVWLNLSNGASSDTATKSISLVDDSDESDCDSNCEDSDSFIVFADGLKGDACTKNQSASVGNSKSQALGLNEGQLLPPSYSPEPNLKQVVVVEKDNHLSNGGVDSIIPGDNPINRKRRKKKNILGELVPKESDQEQEGLFASNSTRVYLYIQMQLCRKESLREWLRDDTSHLSDKKQCLLIFDQIVQAVEYVHLRGLIHRDLKPSNIFFSQEGQIKVGDFGLVTAMVEAIDMGKLIGDESGMDSTRSQRHTAQVGTQLYMSPEQLMEKPYNYKVDIYSLGLIFFELLVPFATQMERLETLKGLRENKFPPNFHLEYPSEFQLLSLMLSKNPDDRPTTFGIRSRPPLLEIQDASINEISKNLHYHLPVRQDSSSSSSLSQSN
ncbi:eukaryotic translation initiation factor 2-alpha kinase isoform X2 [Hetaerina americana]